MKCQRIPDGVDDRECPHCSLPDEGSISAEHLENAKRLNIKMIPPSQDPLHLFKTNPIYCGLVSFNLLRDFEVAGISLCNWHKSIWPTAHLYNALQRTSSITTLWPEMDELINLHLNTLFAGQVPLSAHEFFVRFALALGVSMSSIACYKQNRTSDQQFRFRQGADGTKLESTEMASVFRQYFDQKSSLEVCLVKLDSLIRKPGSRASRKEREAWRRPLTNLQFLNMLQANLPSVVQRLRFDYIT